MLSVVADDDVHGVILQQVPARRLDIAAGGDDGGFRIHAFCPVQHLS